ncbi:hypothetical protein Bca101_092544 [Brassica carinata]
MITRYYDALRQVQFDQGKIKRIAEIMNIPESEVQRESNKLNKVARRTKRKDKITSNERASNKYVSK